MKNITQVEILFICSFSKTLREPKNELKKFVNQLQEKTEQMALRITEEWIDFSQRVNNFIKESETGDQN